MAAYEFTNGEKTYVAEYEDGARINGVAKDRYAIWWPQTEGLAYERAATVWVPRKLKEGSDKFFAALRAGMNAA